MRPKISKQLRKIILERDKHRCIVCWRKYEIDVHHFWNEINGVYRNPYGNTKEKDCVTLCDSCHGKSHTCDKKSPFYLLIKNYLANQCRLFEESKK